MSQSPSLLLRTVTGTRMMLMRIRNGTTANPKRKRIIGKARQSLFSAYHQNVIVVLDNEVNWLGTPNRLL